MIRGLSIASTSVALMLASSASGDQTFVVHRLDAELRTVGSATWRIGGSVSGPVHVSVNGEVVALVADASGRLHLVRWGGDGREVARRAVDLVAPVRRTRLAGIDSLVAVTETELARVSLANGRIMERVPLGFSLGAGYVAPSPHGAWFALRDRLAFVGLDGRRVDKALPLGVPPPPEDGGVAYLLATEEDECVLAELQDSSHSVSGRDAPDRTSRAVLTLLSPGGEVLARTTRGRTRTEREWFWIEGSAAGPVPRGIGIVRRRYVGSVYLEAMGELAGGGFVLLSLEDVGPGEGRHEVIALDRSLRETWSAAYVGRPWGPSPPATEGILFRTELGRVRWYDEAGRGEREAALQVPRGVEPVDLLGTALGRDPGGRWVVVSYGPLREATPVPE